MLFAEVLNEFLIERNMTKRSFAKSCHITTSQMTSFMRGAIPSIATIVKMADFMECSINFLMGIDEDRQETKVLRKGYDMTNFLQRYDYALKLNHTSNWKVCKELKISESNVRGWRHGSMPKLETLSKIASLLHMSIDYFVGRAKE